MPRVCSVLEDRYRLDELIGRGGMADVFRARDLRLHRDVAVKVLRDIEHERRFEREARTLALLDHPNLVQLLDAGGDDDQYLVMELLSGASVDELLRQGLLEPAQVAAIGRETAAALDFIHSRGIVHRDVKPSNLMFDAQGSIRLADFGIVRLVDGTVITGIRQTIGTMAYLAPEQLRGGEVGPPADVYALGLVLLECLTGRRVFDGTPAEVGAARIARDAEIPAGLPPPWPVLLQEMTARQERARPTAREVRERLEALAEEQPLATTAVLAIADDRAAATVPTPIVTGARSAPIVMNPLSAYFDGGDSRGATGRSRRVAMVMAGVVLATGLVFGLWAATREPAGTPGIRPINPPRSNAPVSTTAPAATRVAPTTVVPTSPPTTLPPQRDRGNEGPGNGSRNGNGRGDEGADDHGDD